MPTWLRRTVIAVLLAITAAAVVGLVLLPSGSAPPSDQIIESITPGESASTLQQARLTVDLLTGWEGSLEIDGRPIPDDELVKVREQGTISFQPGPGKALEYYPAGQNCATLTYWQTRTGPSQSFTKRWCFTAT